ncbi:MAG: DUF927 domain-containing protein [Sphingobacteriia bacterium]|nr:DUF927 domain-containing protein [Sphingobacteriia bacterium]
MHNYPFAPLKDEELNINYSKTNDKSKPKPIIPVPDDAEEFNFVIPKFGGEPDNKWPYHNSEGKIVTYKCRWDFIDAEKGIPSKEYRPVSYCLLPNGKRRWQAIAIPTPWVLYNVHKIIQCYLDILLCEGEKSAEKGQILFPNLIATTTMFGAQSPDKTDFSPLKGRNVIICTDNDEPGRAYGDKVYDQCIEVGVASVYHLAAEELGKFIIEDSKIVERQGLVPQGYDLADAYDEGWRSPLINQIIGKIITPYIKKSEIDKLNSYVNQKFKVEPNGVYYLKRVKTSDGQESTEWTWFCSYLVVTHLARDMNGKNWSRIIQLYDSDRKLKEYILPMSDLAGDGNSYREDLLSYGLVLSPYNGKNLLNEYIITSNPKERAICVSKTGWFEGCYILPSKVIGQTLKERIVLQSTISIKPLVQKGTLESWQQTIGMLSIGNSRLIITIALALSGPLLRLLNEENFGIHFYGNSSIGKTTALVSGQSIWGNPINSWRLTDNAAEGLARNANDSILLLDELSQADGKTADALAYMLGNGSGKARSKRNGEARDIESFKLTFLSSGETQLSSKIQEERKQAKAGQTVRFIEIPADAGQGHGLFENIHHFKNANELSLELKRLSADNCGMVIEKFLEILTANQTDIVERINKARDSWLECNTNISDDGQVKRVARKLSLLAAVGELCIALGILPWEPDSACMACSIILKDWIKQRGGNESYEYTEAANRLRLFIAQHGSSRFEVIGSNKAEDDNQNNLRIIDRAGYKKLNAMNEWEFYIFNEIFAKEILNNNKSKGILKYLATEKLIKQDAYGKNTISIKAPNSGQIRMYCVPASNVMMSDKQNENE